MVGNMTEAFKGGLDARVLHRLGLLLGLIVVPVAPPLALLPLLLRVIRVDIVPAVAPVRKA